jgi:hypothetical protein
LTKPISLKNVGRRKMLIKKMSGHFVKCSRKITNNVEEKMVYISEKCLKKSEKRKMLSNIFKNVATFIKS